MAKTKKVVATVTTGKATLANARAANGTNSMVAKNAKSIPAAKITYTSKGANPKRLNVYGYSNSTNGGSVPKAARVLMVTGAGTALPKGLQASQWASLQAKAKAGTQTVAQLYTAGITSRTVRRAYRAGVIRFAA